ncbi:Rap1a/Tai family immunity protein [Bradyrhizobium oligotrophicum]|uniref:Rap1a/Tai family immunity protein n=1 Tax=Bradyrhizobium oligotrophicum TaxID=44255 RepID=UPI003EBB504B
MRIVFAVLMLLILTVLPARCMESASELLTSCESFLGAYRANGKYFQLQGATGSMWECWGFINALQQLSSLSGDPELRTTMTGACPPAQVTAVQLMRVIVLYLQKHPESLHQKAAAVSIYALQQAFPCK